MRMRAIPNGGSLVQILAAVIIYNFFPLHLLPTHGKTQRQTNKSVWNTHYIWSNSNSRQLPHLTLNIALTDLKYITPLSGLMYINSSHQRDTTPLTISQTHATLMGPHVQWNLSNVVTCGTSCTVEPV